MPASSAHWRGEIAVGAAMIATAGAFCWLSSDMPVGSLAAPGPGLFPLLLAGFLTAAAIGVLVRAWTGRARYGDRVELFPTPVFVGLGSLVAVAIAFELVGYFVTFAVFLVLLFRVLAHISWFRAILTGLLVAWCARMLFAQALGVQLPAGAYFPI